MKLSFTTLGCPAWDLPTIVRRATEYGFQGVDFRGYLGEMQVYRHAEFAADREATARQIADAGLEVVCFCSGAALMPTARMSAEASLDELKAYADLCPIFGARQIRVFGQGIGERTWEQAVDEAATTLATMASIAGDHGAKVLLETHDAWVKADHIRALMERTDSPHVGVIWDVHHPWRHADEPLETTWAELGPWVANTHWKDARLPDHSLCLMGEGGLPLREFHDVLKRGGYEGYYTLEWEKKHHPELEEPEVALPNFVAYMQALEHGE